MTLDLNELEGMLRSLRASMQAMLHNSYTENFQDVNYSITTLEKNLLNTQLVLEELIKHLQDKGIK